LLHTGSIRSRFAEEKYGRKRKIIKRDTSGALTHSVESWHVVEGPKIREGAAERLYNTGRRLGGTRMAESKVVFQTSIQGRNKTSPNGVLAEQGRRSVWA